MGLRQTFKGQFIYIILHIFCGNRSEICLRHLYIAMPHEFLNFYCTDILHSKVSCEGVPEPVQVKLHT